MISRFEAFVATLLLVTVAFGLRNKRKFSRRSTAYLFITFFVDFLFVYFVCFVG
jgi:glycerol uptake facilitator-like aquaporin